ncbi:MAG: two-component system OmpR family response regulator MtrA [Elusimicrobia bacterium]|nr:MAG: two-component system OmpR family response regulator MtrA [Elusimicrobiota bacterium]KAF0155045.1 MAG: two-component system OmpR family response regulator MtrA [Elusimicrobiota bacterium]
MSRILVVDDIPAITDFSKEFFEDFGHDVRIADTATGAIATQREFRAEVILQDLNVPGGGGLHVYETLRAEGDMVPIIFSTGKPETLGDLNAMKNVSALRKPTHPDALMAEVQKWLAATAGQSPAAQQPAAQAAPPPPPAALRPEPSQDERPMNPPPPPPKFPR